MNPWRIARFHRTQRMMGLTKFSPSSPHPRRQRKGAFRKRYVMTAGVERYALDRHYMYDHDWQHFIIDKKPKRR